MAYPVAVRMFGNDQAAEDVAREALVAAWRQLPSFRRDASYPTWLLQIVIHQALNYSARATWLNLNGDVISAARPAPAARGLTADAVTAAVAALPPPQRVAFGAVEPVAAGGDADE